MLENNYEKITVKYLDKIKFNENLSKYHTFRINGIAKLVIEPTETEELVDIIKICKDNNYKFNIIGNGSNILFENGCYEGVLIVTKKMKTFEIDGNKIKCACGVPMPLIAQQALKHSLAGLEKLSGIPGTIGGAIKMNAGAYGVEIKDVLTSVTICDKDCSVRTIDPKELELSYRYSNVTQKGYVIIGCELTLTPGNYDDIKQVIDECRNKRLASQPIEYPNAGSIFKKEGEHFAGKLIDDCGLKGFSVGGAMVSTKHANFIVNKENATFQDVIDLITYIKQTIYIQNKVQLHTEVEII